MSHLPKYDLLPPTTAVVARTKAKSSAAPILIAGSALAALLLFVLIFLGGAAWWWLGSRAPAHAIENVLQQDKALSDQAHQMKNDGTPQSQAVHWLVDHMASIDLAACPPDFAEAYVRHIGSWRAAAGMLDEQPDSFLGSFLEGFVNSLGGEEDGGISRERRDAQEASDKVEATWTEVEAAAARYHVKAPTP